MGSNWDKSSSLEMGSVPPLTTSESCGMGNSSLRGSKEAAISDPLFPGGVKVGLRPRLR